ncbi:MAG TPA: hypothetical protein VGB28_07200, partial [Actinomycetota bacterium]
GGGGVVPFRARLTRGGSPIAGAELTFDIEWYGPGLAGETVIPYRFRAHGFTDQDGWATGHLDLDEYLDWYGGSPPSPLRIAARFHGDAGRRTALATQPFAVED